MRNNLSGDFELYSNLTGGTPRMMIKDDGSVGIGTSNPSCKLDLTGVVRASDGLNINGSNNNGITVQNSSQNGIWVDLAGSYGVRVSSSIYCGVYITNTGGSGFMFPIPDLTGSIYLIPLVMGFTPALRATGVYSHPPIRPGVGALVCMIKPAHAEGATHQNQEFTLKTQERWNWSRVIPYA